jgi:hypothetical protein
MKWIGKKFKKVGKIAAVVLAVAAIVFTAGAAIPAIGAIVGTGGFGAAVGGVVASTGLTGTAAAVATGAVTAAGYGAIIGGVTAGATGKDVLSGMAQGAAAGAVTGGVLGGVGALGTPAAGSIGADGIPNSIAITPAQQLGGVPASVPITPANWGASGAPSGLASSAAPATGDFGVTPLPSPPVPTAPPAVSTAPTAAPSAATGAPTGATGLFSHLWDAVSKPEVLGGVIKGIGEGMYGSAQAQDAKDMRQWYSNNYQTGNAGLFTQGPNQMSGVGQPNPALASPADHWGFNRPPQAMGSTDHWEYDPVSRRLVKIKGQ